jgi:hypothetical protein
MMKPNTSSIVPILAFIYTGSLLMGGTLAAARIKQTTARSSQPGSISMGVPYGEDSYTPYGTTSGTPGSLLFNTAAYQQANSPVAVTPSSQPVSTFSQPTLASLSSTSGQAFSAMG